jgi:hypothetical protein
MPLAAGAAGTGASTTQQGDPVIAQTPPFPPAAPAPPPPRRHRGRSRSIRRLVPLVAAPMLVVTVLAGCQPSTTKPPVQGQRFPTAATTGTPSGWKPTRVVSGDLDVTTPNTTIKDIEVTGSINVHAANTTITRVRVHGRIWNQWFPPVEGSKLTQYRMVISSSTIGDVDTTATGANEATEAGAVGPGNYTLLASELYGSDGFRVSEAQALAGGDGSVAIGANFFKANHVPDCGFHVDGVQGYFGGSKVVVAGNTIDSRTNCATGAIFFADNSKAATVDGNLLLADSYPLRIQDDHTPDVGPWVIHNNALVFTSGPGALTPNTDCGARTMSWTGNLHVQINASYQVTSVGAAVPC